MENQPQYKPLWVDPGLQRLIKIEAAKEGKSLKEIAEEILKKWLAERAVA